MEDDLEKRLRDMATWEFLEPDRSGHAFDATLIVAAADALADARKAREELAKSNEWLRSDRALECVDGCQRR